MNSPGFTAEASLAKGDTPYNAVGEARPNRAILQPAQGSERYDPHRNQVGLVHPGLGNCLKRVCTLYPIYDPIYHVKVGVEYGPPCYWVPGWCW